MVGFVTNVKEEPAGGSSKQMHSVTTHELHREELVLHVGVDGADGICFEVDVEDLAHVGSGLLAVAFDESGVTGSLGHLHTVVEGGKRGDSTEGEDETPQKVGLAGSRSDGINGEHWDMVDVVEDGRGNNTDGSCSQNSHSLHSEHGSHECSSGPGVGVLTHYCCTQRVISSNTESKPEPINHQQEHIIKNVHHTATQNP